MIAYQHLVIYGKISYLMNYRILNITKIIFIIVLFLLFIILLKTVIMFSFGAVQLSFLFMLIYSSLYLKVKLNTKPIFIIVILII